MYHTVDGVATEATRDYVDVMKTPLVFGIGEREKIVQVSTLEDDTPEPDETFYLELFGAEGRTMNCVALTFRHMFCSGAIFYATDVVSVLDKSESFHT